MGWYYGFGTGSAAKRREQRLHSKVMELEEGYGILPSSYLAYYTLAMILPIVLHIHYDPVYSPTPSL
eukprot:2938126-Rhodomonas_salina.2